MHGPHEGIKRFKMGTLLGAHFFCLVGEFPNRFDLVIHVLNSIRASAQLNGTGNAGGAKGMYSRMTLFHGTKHFIPIALDIRPIGMKSVVEPRFH